MKQAPKRRGSRLRRKQRIGLLFVAPAVAFVAVFFVLPLIMTVWMSLHNWPLLGAPKFIGMKNYELMLHDTKFWNAMGFTIYYTVVVTIIIFLIAFPLALFVEKPRPLSGFYRTAFFMPGVVGFGAASLISTAVSRAAFHWLPSCARVMMSRLEKPSGSIASARG